MRYERQHTGNPGLSPYLVTEDLCDRFMCGFPHLQIGPSSECGALQGAVGPNSL